MNQIADDSDATANAPTEASCVHMTRTSEQQRTDGMHRPPTVQQQAVTHTAAAMVEHASLLSLLSITLLPHLSVHIIMSASAGVPVSTAQSYQGRTGRAVGQAGPSAGRGAAGRGGGGGGRAGASRLRGAT